MTSAAWDGQEQPMATTGEDEFHNFLDMGNMGNVGDAMHFDFHGLQQHPGQPINGQPSQGMQDSMMSNYTSSNMMQGGDAGFIQHQHNQQMQPANANGGALPISAAQVPHNSISDIDAQIQYLQQQKLQQQQRQIQGQQGAVYSHQTNNGHSVPPTPQSLEMAPGNNNPYYSQPEQTPHSGIFDGGYQQSMKDQQDMAFTPLVSPAVTPLDAFFNMENNFTVPNNYFSPLTSPALHPQNDHSAGYEAGSYPHHPSVEMEVELAPQGGSSKDLAKTARKNNASAKGRKAAIKSSPIVKPTQRRKTAPSPAIVSKVLTEVEERNTGDAMLPVPATSTDGSEENISVSPENLNDMPPPPVPVRSSNSKSPYMQPQSDNSSTPVPSPNKTAKRNLSNGTKQKQTSKAQKPEQSQQPHPATPASLMRLPASKTKRSSAANTDQALIDNIESLELPESVSNLTAPESSSKVISAAPATATEPHNVGPRPFQSPSIKASGTPASQSPRIAPGSSGPSGKKTPLLASRNSRHRSSSSVHVSPALLPRISPNIKPLLPGTPGGVSAEDTVSRLLTSKSNYQNIMEGNSVPGISYPSELSTNLNMKRTSHKIAEQGRRNRINSALQVMANLLPDQPKVGEGGEESDKKDAKQANAANSKASVVENAIVHMQSLQQENATLKDELTKLKQQLEKIQGSEQE